jgi:DNA-binding response OmpR family regulator
MNVLTSVPRALPPDSWEHYLLVVESNPELRDSFRAGLRAAGFAAIAIEDVAGALRLVATQRPSAIILDLSAPGLDVLAIQQDLKANPDARDIPVVVVAGSDIGELNLDDVACLLMKPITMDALIVAVKHVVRTMAPRRFKAF